jgi:hypothetical protein
VLAAAMVYTGELAAAEPVLRESQQSAAAAELGWSRGIALNTFGDFLRTGGDTTQAGQAYEQALSLFASIDPHRPYIPHGLLHNLGYVALAGGDIRRAASLFVESADVYRGGHRSARPGRVHHRSGVRSRRRYHPPLPPPTPGRDGVRHGPPIGSGYGSDRRG